MKPNSYPSLLCSLVATALVSMFLQPPHIAAQAVTAPNQWTWVGGDSSAASNCQGQCGRAGVYGNLGTPAPQNLPGSRKYGASWTDDNGNLWLFGGHGYDIHDQIGDLNDVWEYSPATTQWTWMGGSSSVTCGTNACSQPGTYGTKGTPDKSNIPPGRNSATAWADSKGHLWLFGGQFSNSSNGQTDSFNDLWEFDPASNIWTWIAGDDTVPNSPSEAGQPGVYGQQGTPSASNTPGARIGPFAWQDSSGNFWLARGWGYDVNDNLEQLTDVWEFNPANAEWTWAAGNQGGLDLFNGIYGSLGIANPANMPGSRTGQAAWMDRSGNLWLFGGGGTDSVGKGGALNDVWMLNTTTSYWTWIGGSSTITCSQYGQLSCGRPGVYGTEGVPDPLNIPGARGASAVWIDSGGNVWVFGGGGFDLIGLNPGELNDLWEFDISSNKWTWMGGGEVMTCFGVSCGNSGIYGTLGTPSSGNAPGGRYGAMDWTDAKGNLWLFGGYGYDGKGSIDYLNDLWVYQPVEPLPATATPTFSIATGTYPTAQTVSISDSTPNATIYYTTDGSTPNTYSAKYSAPITVSSTEVIEAIAIAPNYSASAIAKATYDILVPVATPVFSVPSGTYTSAQSVTISVVTPAAAIFYTTDGSTPTSSSTPYIGAITVSKTETIQAIATKQGYDPSAVASVSYTINIPQPMFSLTSSASTLTINHGTQGTLTLTVTPQNGFNSAVTFACSGLPTGATCSFSPSSVTPSGSAINTTLTIAASASASAAHPTRNPFLPAAGLTLAGCLLAFTRRRAPRLWLVPLAALVFFGALSACGGGGNPGGGGGGGGGGGPQNYTITVNATSGSIHQSTQITLTIN